MDMEVKVKKLKNVKAACKSAVIRKMKRKGAVSYILILEIVQYGF